MFLPPAPESTDKTREAIPDVKKNSASPFEADLLQMAEMVAEDKDKEHSQGGWWILS